MEQNDLESIWVDGVPNRIDPKDRLTPLEILRMCIHYSVENIIAGKEYKIINVIDTLYAYPNIILEKEEKHYAVAVVPCIYPYFMPENDELRIGFAKASKEKGFIPILCPIPVRSIDEERAKQSIYLKGDVFQFANIGQKILTDDVKQEITPQNLDFRF